MATWKSAAYDGRYLQLDISESVNVVGNSSTLSWTLTSAGGASTYYTIDTTTVTINGTTVYSKGRTYWDDRVFPAKKGSVSGTITVAHDSSGSKTIAVGFSTRVYIYGSQEYGGSISIKITVLCQTKHRHCLMGQCRYLKICLGGICMSDYKAMYYHLAGRMATAIDALEATTNALVDITKKLKLAQQTTEEMFSSSPDGDADSLDNESVSK